MTDKKGLTTCQLKVFACLVMVIDHVSAISMPFYDPMDSSTWPWAFALNNDCLLYTSCQTKRFQGIITTMMQNIRI